MVQYCIMDHYNTIKSCLEFIDKEHVFQPSIEMIAEHANLTPIELNALFRDYSGLTPMTFLQAVTLNHARELLKSSASVMDAAFETGLSSPSRLHDLFVTLDAISPGEYKAKGEGLTLHYAFHSSPFGKAIVVTSQRGLVGLGFCDEGEEIAAVEDMHRRWIKAKFVKNQEFTIPYFNRIFNKNEWLSTNPLSLHLIGTDFEISVWQSLLHIPLGHLTTYGALANHIEKPKASRAVGAAVGKNPISFVVPCHRAIGQSGALTGYHWGLTRKKAMLGWEKGILANP
jgi:AraC family transcriptional regulator, regulatory protein of adaptative response / methylated-DNA-[protein]-cysteine methyltransferase